MQKTPMKSVSQNCFFTALYNLLKLALCLELLMFPALAKVFICSNLTLKSAIKKGEKTLY